MENHEFDPSSPTIVHLVARISLCLKQVRDNLPPLDGDEPAMFAHHLDECEIILADLDRSLALMSHVTRITNDAANARIRARSLHFELSQALNLAIGAADSSNIGACLDAAKSVAKQLTIDDQVALEKIVESFPATRLTVAPYFLNLGYELLEETDLVLRYKDDGYGPFSLIRCIDLPPEHLSAGLTIIQNFVNIVRQRYSSCTVKARIVQSGNSIKLIIDAPEGREEIEELFTSYADVLAGRSPVESFAISPVELMDLKAAVRIAEVQLSIERDKAQLLERTLNATTRQLDQTTLVLSLVTGQLSTALADCTKNHSEALLASHAHVTDLVDMLRGYATGIPDMKAQMDVLIEAASGTVVPSDELAIKTAAEDLRIHKPTTFHQIRNQIISSSVSALLVKWLIEVGPTLLR